MLGAARRFREYLDWAFVIDWRYYPVWLKAFYIAAITFVGAACVVAW